MTTEKIIISSNDIDANLNLKLAAFFRIMQDVIMHDTNLVGIGASDLRKQNILWVITRVQVEISRMPKYEEEVTCITYPGADLKMFYPRYFRMVDKDGNILVNLSSVWAIIDATTRRPILKCPFQEKLYEEHLVDELPLPSKINVEDELNLKEERKIHYSEVDLNNHLNNTRYIELISDIHDSSFHLDHPTISLELNYLKEIHENAHISIYSNDKNPEILEVKSDENVNFIARITYKE